MDLLEYRHITRLSRDEIAELIGVCAMTVWRIETGRVMPRPETMRRIKLATKGAVTPNDLLAVVEQRGAA